MQDEPAARPLRLQVLLGCTSPARGSDPGPWSERLAELVELIVSDDGAGSRILPDPCAFRSRPRRQAPLVEDGVALQQRRCRRHGSCAAPLWMRQLSTVRQGPCPQAQAWVGFARRRCRHGGGSSFQSACSPGPGAGLARNQRDGGNHGASGARGFGSPGPSRLCCVSASYMHRRRGSCASWPWASLISPSQPCFLSQMWRLRHGVTNRQTGGSQRQVARQQWGAPSRIQGPTAQHPGCQRMAWR